LLALPGDPLTILLRGEKSGVGIVERISDRDDRAIGELPRRDFARGGGEGRVERGTEDPVRLDRGCPGASGANFAGTPAALRLALIPSSATLRSRTRSTSA